MAPASPILEINGGHQLLGKVKLTGSKNGTLAVLCACTLTQAQVTLIGAPYITDVINLVIVLQSIGVSAVWKSENVLQIQRPAILNLAGLDVRKASQTRAVILLAACFAYEKNDFSLPLPGGCRLGLRSIEPHVDALQQLGLQVKFEDGGLRVRRCGRSASTVTLMESGDTVTENALLAAIVTHQGPVRIENASCNYMVQDLCLFLQSLGATIGGVGTSSLTITSPTSSTMGTVSHSLLEDPIEAFFFVALAAVTKSTLQINRVPTGFISLELRCLVKMGLSIESSASYLAANDFHELYDLKVSAVNLALLALDGKVHPNVFPYGVNVDNLPALASVAATSHGTTRFHDWMYESRVSCFSLFKNFGVHVDITDAHRAQVTGCQKLRAGDCDLPSALRPASMILLIALAAPGVSRLQEFEVLYRGYDRLLPRLEQLGAKVSINTTA
ncbi:EPT/RTPC-like protein [Polychaeton citri CBS 116435]|uniref:UDP-N-acetylglucosamine 1-carboxyvinyltransferase n=1 Tax=Polychaeton citri CBS 116435 TaxID=1314669 RepID=A0A9P4UUZ8_9PEZI|nr:EPT/RTPC-like protein [Polychaeton citri CBS 116435]